MKIMIKQKHLYNQDSSLTDEGARLIHDVRLHLRAIYQLLEGYPLHEIENLVMQENYATMSDFRKSLKSTYENESVLHNKYGGPL